MHAALAPVIGNHGVAALYKRCVHLACEDRPWLPAAYDTAARPGDFTALRKVLAGKDEQTAAAAHEAMFRALHRLLANLIGSSLTSRLLHDVPFPPSAGRSEQDESP